MLHSEIGLVKKFDLQAKDHRMYELLTNFYKDTVLGTPTRLVHEDSEFCEVDKAQVVSLVVNILHTGTFLNLFISR